jgi:autotransporter strand-loop-strand O-heptosyltransferase
MKRVKINLMTTSLGDSIGAVSQINRFQKINNYNVACFISEKYVNLFKESYKNIKFNPLNFDFDEQKDLSFVFEKPLQKGFSDQLGIIDYKEERPRIYISEANNSIPNKKYITISIQSTHQGRYWNNPKGWDSLIKYLKNKYGVRAICIDQYESYGREKVFNRIPAKAINRCGMDLASCINYIKHGLFHIGTSNGLSWLAHGCGKHVILISNVTKKWCEFTQDVTRIYDESICNGCLNEEPFDYDDWMWCPRKKNFECTRKISFNTVKENIDRLAKDFKLL